MIFWMTVKFLKRMKIKNDLITTLVISNFILQPSVIDMMTRILSCQEVDQGKFYISAQLTLECYSDEHYQYVFIIEKKFKLQIFLQNNYFFRLNI